MTPAEAIAALGGTVEAARAKITLSKNGPCSMQEHDAIYSLALHALTDSGARGALERVRIDIHRLQPQFVGEHETVSGSAMGRSQTVNDALRIIDRELAALPPTATAAQPAEPGLTIADTEAWVGELCEDSAKVDKEADAWRDAAIAYLAGAWAYIARGMSKEGAPMPSECQRMVSEAVRIMRTRGDALRAAERERTVGRLRHLLQDGYALIDWPKDCAFKRGAQVSMVQCNYDSVDFPRQVVEALDAIDTRLRALEGK